MSEPLTLFAKVLLTAAQVGMNRAAVPIAKVREMEVAGASLADITKALAEMNVSSEDSAQEAIDKARAGRGD